MIQRALVLLAEGFEEIEAVTIVDVLRRANVATLLVGLSGMQVVGAHGVVVQADELLEEVTLEDTDALILPGGGKGSDELEGSGRVIELVRQAAGGRGLVGAICAAPKVLERAGVLQGKKATSFPGVPLPSATYSEARVVEAGNIITSRGPGTALEFALFLVAKIRGPEERDRLASDMLALA